MSVFGLPLSLGAGPEERRGNDRKGDGAHQHKPKDDDDMVAKGLAQRIRALERKLQYVTSRLGEGGLSEVVITGANLRIVNGLEATETTNGLGNVIVGYNELANSPQRPHVRTGSHNVIVGQFHNFSQFGGLVVGRGNEISGEYAVSAGRNNTASGPFASVTEGNSTSRPAIPPRSVGGHRIWRTASPLR